jgi:hypothetical protein
MSYPVIIEGRDEEGLNDRSFSHTGVPLLASFDFQFQDGLLGSTDHHIQQVLICPDFEPDTMRLGYQDEGGDDDYEYRILPLSPNLVSSTPTCRAAYSSSSVARQAETTELMEPTSQQARRSSVVSHWTSGMTTTISDE